MQPREKISKSSWTLLEGIKDSTVNNIADAVKSGQLKIESNQMTTLLALISASVDEGYHKAHRIFMKSVDVVLSEAVANETFPTIDKKNIKKN
jgi:hypothetical protein